MCIWEEECTKALTMSSNSSTDAVITGGALPPSPAVDSSIPASRSSSTSTFSSTSSSFGGGALPPSPAVDSSIPASGSSSTSTFSSTSSSFGGPFGSTQPSQQTSGRSIGFGSSIPLSFTTAFGQPASIPSTRTSSFGEPASVLKTSCFGDFNYPFAPQSLSTSPSISVWQSGQRGSRVAAYAPTPDADVTTQRTHSLTSISAMPVYNGKSVEMLRWEDYQLGDKGGLLCSTNISSSSVPAPTSVLSTSASASASSTSPFTFEPSRTFSFQSATSHGTTSQFGPNIGFGRAFSPSLAYSGPVFGLTTSLCGQNIAPAFAPQSISTSPSISVWQSRQRGSRVAAYAPTSEVDVTTQRTHSLTSISAMPVYNGKSVEMLRWEDYQLGDKGGPLCSTNISSSSVPAPTSVLSTSASASASSTSPFTFEPSRTFSFQSATSHGTTSQFAPNIAFGRTFSPSFFNSTEHSLACSGPVFGPTTSPCGQNIAPAFNHSNLFGNFGETFPSLSTPSQPAQFTLTAGPALAQSTSPFRQNSPLGFCGLSSSLITSSFAQTTLSLSTPSQHTQFTQMTGPALSFAQSTSPFRQNEAPGFYGQSSSLTSSFAQTTPSVFTPFQPAQVAQAADSFSCNYCGQALPVGANSYIASGIHSQSNTGPSFGTPISAAAQPPVVTIPFGNMGNSMPQMTIDLTGTAPSVQYGIRSGAVSSAAAHPLVTFPIGLRLPNAIPQMEVGVAGTAPSVPHGNSSTPVNNLCLEFQFFHL
ncbi:nuclear pore complex protein NUP98A [Quillaja saponaria]|uniref:Nuclear pore complex protein NUP98A n=1 Tax=Quillaja saponaria TaxID=32244 RepID=A0AAD7KQE4_QUISA|nr:nuclear pore complex protein NUP98A [Quillaja saponaria]